MEKTCFKCGESKPLSSFYKHKEMADGHLGKCKVCTKKDVSKNYKDNREYYQEYERHRNNMPDRAQFKTDACRKHRMKYPDKYAARNAVGNALRDGRITRPLRCSECGINCIPEAHHEDYNEPLTVTWLCSECHEKR